MVFRVYKTGNGSGSFCGRQTPGDRRLGVVFKRPLTIKYNKRGNAKLVIFFLTWEAFSGLLS